MPLEAVGVFDEHDFVGASAEDDAVAGGEFRRSLAVAEEGGAGVDLDGRDDDGAGAGDDDGSEGGGVGADGGDAEPFDAGGEDGPAGGEVVGGGAGGGGD